MLIRALVVLVTALALVLPSAAEAKRKIRRRPPATQPARALAQVPAGDTADGDDVPPPSAGAAAIHVAGKYQGVRPGQVGVAPRAPKAGGAPFLTWSGFMMTEAGSRVFLQLTQQVEYSVAQSGRELVITLKGCRIHRRNNARPVNTRFFATPVAGVQARQHGRDVKVRIGLRKSAPAQPRFEAGEAGYQFLMLDFPPEGGPASQPVN
ncbi:MAG TPA: AMIN domain-containing protein [Polyangia bacterium]